MATICKRTFENGGQKDDFEEHCSSHSPEHFFEKNQIIPNMFTKCYDFSHKNRTV